MNLIIDAGNTRIKLALYDERRMVEFIDMANWNLDQISRFIGHPGIQKAILSSVRIVPDEVNKLFTTSLLHSSTPSLLHSSTSPLLHSSTPPLLHFSYETSLPIKINYETPETLGNDRVAAAVGAWESNPEHDLLVIDAGTALTMDLVTSDGAFEGGVISPGLSMRFRALHEFTGNLPLTEPDIDAPEIGKSTRQAIQSGVLNGMFYEVDNYINSLKNKYNGLRVILTGGDSFRLTKKLKNPIFVDQYLVLNGLNHILSFNE